MTMLQSQTNLREPVQDLILTEVVFRNFWFAFVTRLQFLYFLSHVAA